MTRVSPLARGYTLIEVLVAFTILALALTVLFRIFSTGIGNVDVAAQYTQAVLVAEARLDALGLSEPLEPGRTEGVAADRFAWTRTITAVDLGLEADPGGQVRAYRVQVAVEWPATSGPRRIEFATVRLEQPSATIGGLR